MTTIRGIAIETSGREGSVAAVLAGRPIATDRFEHGLKHAAGLVPMLDRVIASAGWTPADITELYLSVGPGSFTGLRIGVTLAKTWWLARGTRIVAVPSVRAIVENLPPSAQHAAVVLDAKRGQIFTASYSRDADGIWQETRPPRLSTLAAVALEDPKPLLLTGEGLSVHPVPPNVTGVGSAASELWQARAEVVATLGFSMARQGDFADPMTLTPTYVRLPEAEEKWRLAREIPL